jgi:hypothetical protein
MVFPVSMGDVTKTVLHTLFLSECLRPCNRPALDAPGIWKNVKSNFTLTMIKMSSLISPA